MESVRIGKCQNSKKLPILYRYWKVSDSESVRIGKCQNWKSTIALSGLQSSLQAALIIPYLLQLSRAGLRASKAAQCPSSSASTGKPRVPSIEPLQVRRKRRFQLLATKMSSNPRLSHLLPLHVPSRTTRVSKKYKENASRTLRLYNSPVFHMSRVMNSLS